MPDTPVLREPTTSASEHTNHYAMAPAGAPTAPVIKERWLWRRGDRGGVASSSVMRDYAQYGFGVTREDAGSCGAA